MDQFSVLNPFLIRNLYKFCNYLNTLLAFWISFVNNKNFNRIGYLIRRTLHFNHKETECTQLSANNETCCFPGAAKSTLSG